MSILSIIPYNFFLLFSLLELPTYFSFHVLLLSSRGPWGALSPIPENNAIAVNIQVCDLFCSCVIYNLSHRIYIYIYILYLWRSLCLYSIFCCRGDPQPTPKNLGLRFCCCCWSIVGRINFFSFRWFLCVLLGCGMYLSKVNISIIEFCHGLIDDLECSWFIFLDGLISAWMHDCDWYFRKRVNSK